MKRRAGKPLIGKGIKMKATNNRLLRIQARIKNRMSNEPTNDFA